MNKKLLSLILTSLLLCSCAKTENNNFVKSKDNKINHPEIACGANFE